MLSSGEQGVAQGVNARRHALFLLFCAYVINYIDRQIVTILQEPIKADLGLSDTQLGLMTGLSFALFYATMGLPMARLADRYPRRSVIAGATLLWSGMTMACAAAGNFVTLLLCRMGVGVGEAGLSPPAHSLISDYYPPHQRAGALGIYSSGIQVGVMLGFLLGGTINHYFGWRAAFLAVGLPGILLSLLIRFTMREPPRIDAPATGEGEGEGMLAAMSQLWRVMPFRLIALACGFHTLVLYGQGHWAPPYLGRVHGMELRDIAFWLALLSIGPGALGLWLAGLLADRLQRATANAGLIVAMGSIVLLLPLEAAFALAPDGRTALMISAATHFLGGAYLAPVIAHCHAMFGSHQRALASAVLLLSLNLIGLGVGPLLVGGLSDTFAASQGGRALPLAMLAILPSQLLALALFWLSSRPSAPAREAFG
jgi:predicted MFS family arabinose efflux permease